MLKISDLRPLVLKQLDWFHGNDGNTIVFLPFQLRLEGQATRFAGGRWLLNAWQGKKPDLLWFSMGCGSFVNDYHPNNSRRLEE